MGWGQVDIKGFMVTAPVIGVRRILNSCRFFLGFFCAERLVNCLKYALY